MKRLPRAVDICSTRYKVLRKKGLKDPDGDLCLGICEPLKACITVESGLSTEVAKQTLLHEIAHAAFEESGAKYILGKFIDNPDHLHEAEELIIRTFLPALVAAMRGIE